MKRRFKTEILVRNNRIQMMQNQGLTVDYRVLSDNEYIQELNNKLLEETNELITAKNEEELKFEIADVLEVIDHIIKINGFSQKEINNIKQEKQNKIGKFDNKFYTNYIEVDENNNVIDYYLTRPKKYPEIK